MASESIAHSAFGLMGYWLRAHSALGIIGKYGQLRLKHISFLALISEHVISHLSN